jgi:beta-galactosidase
MSDQPQLSDLDLKGWHSVRIDDGGVPGRQPNIRATSNQRFTEQEFEGDESDRRVAESFIGLSTSYWRLDPAARYRIRVAYGTPAREPRLQSLEAGGIEVHGPLRIAIGRVESHIYDLPDAVSADGRLSLRFIAHPLPELAGQTEKVADPPIVTRVELYCDREPEPVMIDAATVPDGSIAIAVRSIPGLTPVVGAVVSVVYPDGETASCETNADGDAIVSSPLQAARAKTGSQMLVSAAVLGESYSVEVTVDEAFASTWPSLTIPTETGPGDALEVYLDGTWDFTPSWVNGDSTSSWRQLTVPGQWFQQGFDVAPGDTAAYRRTFHHSARDGRRTILRFDAVYAHAEVWLNGARLGEHEGGFTPFQFEVTGRLESENLLLVLVRSDSISDQVSAASDYAAHSLGGITRGVRLLDLPQHHLSRLHVDAGLDGATGTARVFGTISGLEGDESSEIHLSILDLAGREVARQMIVVRASEPRFSTEIVVDSASPWTAETPTLYRLTARLDSSVEYAQRHCGFRSVAVQGHELQVNGSPIRLRGVERHEQDPVRGRSTLPDLWEKDVELMKGANINNVFTCHYPHAEGFLDLCDERGLWVIDESPTVWVDAQNADDPDTFLALSRPILEMIERDFSRPAVVVWMLGDECLWGRNFWRLVMWLRKEGLRAPLMFSFDIGGPSSLDIASRHYPPLEFGSAIQGIAKPVTFDQFAHLNCYNRRELHTDPEVRDWWGSSLHDYWKRIEKDPRILGGQIWAWSDDEFHLDDSRMIGYGTWGIVDAWRRPKPEWWNVKMVYAPVRIGEVELADGVSGTVAIPLENRYDFLDLDTIELQWATPHESGVARPSGPPRTDAQAELNLAVPLAAGEELILTVVDPVGNIVTAATVTAGGAKSHSDRLAIFEPLQPTRIDIEHRAHVFAPNMPEYDAARVYSGGAEWLFDLESGLLRAGRLSRRAIVDGGPELMLLAGTHTQHVGPHHRHGIEPFTESCKNRVVQSVEWDPAAAAMSVVAEYDEARTEMRYVVTPNGGLEISYRAVVHEPIEPRQTGIVIDLPPTFSTLRWSRDAYWSAYPPAHIGRAIGTAVADPANASLPRADGQAQPPTQLWEDDVTALGSADFRSTRRDIHWASLTDHAGAGLWVEPTEQTQVRAWRSSDHIRLLIASHTSGGSEPLMQRAGQQDHTRRWLAAGDEVSGSVVIRLGRLGTPEAGA